MVVFATMGLKGVHVVFCAKVGDDAQIFAEIRLCTRLLLEVDRLESLLYIISKGLSLLLDSWGRIVHF